MKTRQGKCKRMATSCHQSIQQMYGRRWFSRLCLVRSKTILIIHGLNLGFVYCWRLHQLCTKPKSDQKSFRRAVVQVALMKAHSKVPRPGPSFVIPYEVRFDGKEHYPAPGPVRKCLVQEELSQCVWKIKTKKNAFYFTSKALFVLKIFKFLSWLFGHVSKRLD